MTATVVPYEDPEQTQFLYEYVASPWTPGWWTYQTITEVPGDAVGWLVAQGWQITDIDYDTSTVPRTAYYDMTRQSLQNWIILQTLLQHWVDSYNTANANNTIRYNDVIEDWTELLESSHTHFTNEISEQNTHATSYASDVSTYMDSVETLVADADYENDINAEKDLLSPEYDIHASTTRDLLTDLGSTELARINEKFDATLSTQLQQLTDRGLYSSQLATDITARNTRDRNEEIAALNDRLNREKLQNEHQLYDQLVAMRKNTMAAVEALGAHKHRVIAEFINTYGLRLKASADKHAENMQLMARQLSTRNELLIGLYSFVERRDDVAPQFSELVQTTVGLGDSGGGWISP